MSLRLFATRALNRLSFSGKSGSFVRAPRSSLAPTCKFFRSHHESACAGEASSKHQAFHEFFEQHQTTAQIQKRAPDFAGTAVVDGQFKPIKLEDYKGKYVVLFFYPLDFTFVCPTEIVAFSDRIEEFRKINCEVIAASVDSQYAHLAWINTPRQEGGLGPMKIPMLADVTREVARRYGVLLEDAGVALRGLFIIDDKGVLRQITINDLPVGRSVDETLRLVKAFQFTDTHGEVCPADWTPGQRTMKPDPKGSKTYFAKAGHASSHGKDKH